jgi:uncharacterized protein
VLEKQINEALKTALKERDQTATSVLRMMISEIKNYRIANMVKEELSDDAVLSVLQKMAKRHKESIESFEKGARPDLVEKEKSELEILLRFLPQPLTDKEVENMVSLAISEAGATTMKDMPLVMKAVMPLVKGRADGKLVNELVRKKLGA